MSDTSLVFNIIARDSGVGRTLNAIQRAFRGAGKDAEDALRQAGSGTQNLDRMLEEAHGRVRSLSEEFERTGDKKLFGQIGRDRSLINNLEKIRSTLHDTRGDSDRFGDGILRMGSQIGGALGSIQGFNSSILSMGGAIQGALGPYIQLGVTAGMASAALFAAPAAIYAVGAAAASLPAMLSGAIAALATLKLGLFGIGENWKAMNTPAAGGGGGGAAKQDLTPKIRAVEAAQRQVARSARDITDAQVALKEATDGLNEARVAEKERIEDVRRALASAKADEEDSVQSLAEARMQLALAEQRGNPDEIRRAQIAVDKQAASLEEAKDKTEDLQKENDEAARNGVEGSDAVVAAKKREAQAQRAIGDAVEQHRLAIQQLGDAQKSLNEKMAAGGGGGGLAAQLPKIAKSAQDFLNALKRLKPAFDELRLDVQERLFRNLDKTVTHMWNAWEDQLHVTLGGFADTFNRFARNLGSAVSTPKFIKDIAIGAEGFRQALRKIGDSVTNSLVPAFGALSSAAGPFLSKVGDILADVVTEFSEWILQAEKSGKLETFFTNASKAISDIANTGKLAVKIAGDLISILLGEDKSADSSALDSFNKGLEKIHMWLQDPKNQQKIRDLITDVKDAIKQFAVLTEKVKKFLDGLDKDNRADTAGRFIGRMLIAGILAGMGEGIQASVSVVEGLFKEGVKTSLLGVIADALGISSPSTVMIRYGRNLIEGLIIGMRSMSGALANAARGVKNTVVSGVQNAGTWVYGKGQQVVQGVMGGINSMFPNLGITASNMRVPVYNAVAQSAGSLLYGSGQAIALGLINGINSMGSRIGASVGNLANRVANSLNAALGVRSPSRVTMLTGQYVGQGLALGIESSASQVEAAAGRLAMAAVPSLDGFGNGLQGRLTAAVNGVVQVQPANRKQEVVVRFDVTGAEGDVKRMIQKMIRTQNLLQTN